MVMARHRGYSWAAALVLAILFAGPTGALVIAIGTPTHRCHCPGHVPTPHQEPTFGPCGEEAKAVAAAAPTALPDRPAEVRYLPTVARVTATSGLRPESRLPLPETPPPRLLRA